MQSQFIFNGGIFEEEILMLIKKRPQNSRVESQSKWPEKAGTAQKGAKLVSQPVWSWLRASGQPWCWPLQRAPFIRIKHYTPRNPFFTPLIVKC